MTRATTEAVLRDLVRDCLANDFNECWDSYKAAQEALSAPPMGEAVAWSWDEYSSLVGAWRPRLTFDRPDECNRARNIQALGPLYALAQPGSDGAIPFASPLERERFLSIVGNALNAAYDAGTEFKQGFDPMAEAEVVMEALASTPAIRGGGET